MPLPSTYLHLTMNVDDPARRKEEVAKVVKWARCSRSTAESLASSVPTT